MYDNITEEDKQRLLFDPESGMWSGYKHPYGFKVREPSKYPRKKTQESSNEHVTDSVNVDPLMESNNSTGISATGKTSRTAFRPASIP